MTYGKCFSGCNPLQHHGVFVSVNREMKFKVVLSYAMPAFVLFILSTNTKAQGKVVTVTPSSAIVASKTEETTGDSNLIEAARATKSNSEELLLLQEQELMTAKAKLEELRQLVADGLVARNELTKQEESIAFLEGTVNGTRQLIGDADKLIAGLLKQEELKKQVVAGRSQAANNRSLIKPTLMRYGGTAKWSLDNLPQVQAFFASQFGRGLPTSTIGQSTTHNRLGWDHRHAVDVALHPDSAEGRALIAYLKSQGIPYLAFRGAIPGVSTGPHIHIGTPSHRLG